MTPRDDPALETLSAVDDRRAAIAFQRLWRTPAPEIGVVLLALLTRFWRLSYHSVWFDEAVSLSWAMADPAHTWHTTVQLVEDKHPPLYYLGLHLWQRLASLVGLGQSDAALRAFGSLLGVLTVVGILLLARRLSGRMTGLMAGLLVALSPVLVWYSQELRMFQPATTAVVWSAFGLLRAWQSDRALPRVGWWLLFIGALAAALYSYLFSAFVLPAAGLTLIALWATGVHRRRAWEGVVSLGIATALFLPLAYNAWVVNGDESTPGRAFADLLPNLRRLLKVHTIWRESWGDLLVAACLILLALLIFAGLLLAQRPRRPSARTTPSARIWLVIWLGAPLLVANLLLARSGSIFTQDRYLLFLAPFVLWAIARGVIVIGQRQRIAGWLAGVAVIVMLVVALQNLWTPTYYRENWRAAAKVVSEYQAANPALPAAVVAHIDYTRLPLEWYLRDDYSFEELPIYFPYGGRLSAEEVDEVIAPPLQGIVETGAATLWLTQSHLEGVDETGLVEGWLAANFPLVTEVFPTGVKLSGYALQSRYDALPQLPPDAQTPGVELATGLTLAACEITTPRLSATDEALHPPSGWVHVRLWWQATGPINDDYVASAQMIGAEGVWGERLYRANEALRRWPTGSWSTGDVVRDEIDINLNPLTPENDYPIVVGALDSDGAPTGHTVECGRVEIRDAE